MQNFDQYNDTRTLNQITHLFGRFTLDFILRILETINHALAIGLGFLASAYVQNEEHEDVPRDWGNMSAMAILSILVSYLIEYLKHYAGAAHTAAYESP